MIRKEIKTLGEPSAEVLAPQAEIYGCSFFLS
jgi:hypothetical protein